MNNQKPEGKPAEHEEGDHAQPINLAAPRPPAPSSTVVSGLAAPVANQSVSLRPHGEAPKPSLMTLYFRTPTTTRPSAQGHIMSPVMGAQVASPQHFTAKQALKNLKSMRVNYYQDKLTDKAGSEFNIKVIRVPPPDSVQSPSGSSTPSATSLSPAILPSALTGNSSRHIIPAAVHPGISTGSAVSGSMASIIKGGHQMSQVSHTIHQPFSSHVPRGPAAVANISAGPRSGVATPIVRAPHSSGTMTLASSMISPSTHVRVRSQTMAPGRTPIASSPAYAQVIDLQKNSIGHSLSNQAQLGQTSRSLDMSSSIRTSMQHPPGIAIANAKPINISQPIVQHLQQVSDKSCLKTVSGITTTSAPSNSTPAHQSTTVLSSGHSGSGEVHSVCIVPTITRATVSSTNTYPTNIVQFPSAISQHVSGLRPSLIQPQALSSGMNIQSPQGNQTFAVISTKSLPPSNQPMSVGGSSSRPCKSNYSDLPKLGELCVKTEVTKLRPAGHIQLTAPRNPAHSTSSAVSTVVGVPSCGSTVTSVTSASPVPTRVLSAPSPISHTAAIPIAKVYPQPLPTITQSSTAASGDAARPSAFVTQATNLSSTMKPLTLTTTASTTAVSSVLHTSTIAKRNDSATPVRFTPLTKQPVASSASFSVSSGSYVYDQCATTLAVHPFSVTSTNQGFSTNLPASHIQTFLPQHGSNTITTVSHQPVCVPASTTTAVQPLNSLMVVTDSRHVTLPYNRVTIGAGKTVTDLPTHSSTTVTTTTQSSNLIALSQASSTLSANHSQGGSVINHVSPRPSILRKRTAPENVNSTAKRNLLSSICGLDPGSPSEDVNTGTPALSPKPPNGQLRENGIHLLSEMENCHVTLPCPPITIKKEVVEESAVPDESTKDLLRPAEATPRKKPRKQLLNAIELTETHSSDADDHFEMKKAKDIKTEPDDVKYVTFAKLPKMSLLNYYRQSCHSWKTRHNHFSRYTDVKPKEEKAVLVNELAGQRGITEEVNGWKVYYVTGQTEDLSMCEETVYSRLSHWLDLEKKNSPASVNVSFSQEEMKIANKLADLVKGNLQRSKIAQEQAIESQQQLLKILDHKQNITDILSKYTSRRQAKKKEKT